MNITLSPQSALSLIHSILQAHEERVTALSNAVSAQRAINNNPDVPAGPAQSSLIQFPLQDAELLAEGFTLIQQVAGLKLELK